MGRIDVLFRERVEHGSSDSRQSGGRGNRTSLSAPGGGEGRGEVGDAERLRSPASPSHACGMGPSLSPLKGGEGFSTRPSAFNLDGRSQFSATAAVCEHVEVLGHRGTRLLGLEMRDDLLAEEAEGMEHLLVPRWPDRTQ
jgi:hypothetical protein